MFTVHITRRIDSGRPRQSVNGGFIPYPPFLGYLVLWLGSVTYKSRYPEKGGGSEPTGKAWPLAGSQVACLLS